MNQKFILVSSLMVWAFLLCGGGLAADIPAKPGGGALEAATAFSAQHQGVSLYRAGARITRVYGAPFGTGGSPEDTAEQFRANHAAMFGVDAVDLRPAGQPAGGGATLGLMYQRETQSYKFTLVRYSQYEEDIPVFRSDLRLLTRNEPGYPLVLASSSLKELGDFSIAVERLNDLERPEYVHARMTPARNQVLATWPAMVNFTPPEVVVWAGVDDMPVAPRVALVFVADDAAPGRALSDRRLFVTDLETGAVLYDENRIIDVDVTGSVIGMATEGPGAEHCEDEVPMPMPYARVNIGATVSYTGEGGGFVIPNAGSTAVTVESRIWGLWFRVFNYAGSDALLSQTIVPPGPADFIHNGFNVDPLRRAEVNAYVYANVIRDMVEQHNPDYPGIDIPEFETWVNRTDGYCPGNAWYDPGVPSINFCQAGAGHPNTAWSSVIYHEYGHHLVEAGGSGQGEYGEGTGDVMSVVLLDDSRLGLGFYGDCAEALASADNALQYPCSGAIHYCGQLLAGCVWDTRNELVLSEPDNYLGLLQNLSVNSIPLHSGSSITPTITLDWLTLDDDDGDLGNGTPHSEEILAGFGAHNMIPLPPPENDLCADALEACSDAAVGGQTTSATNDGSSNCGDSGNSPDVWYSYTPHEDGVATFSLCNGTSYDAVLSVHSGCPGTGANDLGCDDDYCASGGASQVTLNVTAGLTYMVRVTGWSGSVGVFSLQISGPGCAPIPVHITYPDGRPETIEPAVATPFTVQIEDGDEIYVSGSGTLHYRYDGGAFLTAPLTPLGGALYEATLPPATCTAGPEFYISAEGDSGSVCTNPVDAPSSVHSTMVGTLTVAFHDDFQSDHGWTVANGGGLTGGAWNRGVPVGGGDRGDPATDADGSGQCYLTDNVDGDSDVDGGYTILTSPVMDASTGGEALLSYDRWFSNSTGGGPFTDTFVVEISQDGGTAWTTLETVGPSGEEVSGGWFAKQFVLNDVPGFTPNSEFRVRFTAEDVDPPSVVEAAVDGVRVVILECVDATCSADLTGDSLVDAADLALLLGDWGTCGDCPADLTGDGLVDAADLALLLGGWGPC